MGGQFYLASVPPKKEDFARLVEFYEGELGRLGVDIRLRTEVDLVNSNPMGADVVFLATGSLPVVPNIPGVDRPHVAAAHQVLAGRAEVREGSVLIVGGGATGLETADYLACRRLSVTVVEMLEEAGRDIMPGIGVRESLLARLEEKGVTILTGCRAVSIEKDSVLVSDRPLRGIGGEKRLPADYVVLGLGGRSDEKTGECNLPAPGRIVRVGDCHAPGNALSAIHAAFDVAVEI